MASIKNRNGSYLITVSLGRDTEGKKLFQTTTYKPTATTPKAIEKEVQRFAQEFESRVKAGKYLSGDKVSFADFVSIWDTDWASTHLTIAVRENYNANIRRHALPELGNMKIAKIHPVQVQSYINKLYQSGLSPATVKYSYACLNSVFGYAYRMKVIDENPCERVELPKQKKSDALHFFDDRQARIFLNALESSFPIIHKSHTRTLTSSGEKYLVMDYVENRRISTQFQCFFNLAVYGGFRREEILALTWADIDFTNQTVSITKACSMTKTAGLIIKETKTQSGVRTIRLPERCFAKLAQWKKEELQLALALGTKWEGQRGSNFEKQFIFIQTDSGKMMNISTPAHKFH